MEIPKTFDPDRSLNIAPRVRVDFNSHIALVDDKKLVVIEKSPFDLLTVLDYTPQPYEILYAKVMQRQAIRNNSQIPEDDLKIIFEEAKYNEGANQWIRENVHRLRNQIGKYSILNDYRGRYYLHSP